MDQALIWSSGHMSLATGYQVLMLPLITGINAPMEQVDILISKNQALQILYLNHCVYKTL